MLPSRLFQTSILTLLLCALGVTVLQAQTGTIRGEVTDSTTTESLPGTTVYIDELQTGDAVGADGTYEIDNVPYGTYDVTYSFIGYEEKIVSVTVDEEVETVNVALSQAITGLDNVVVTAFGIEREQRSIGYSSQSISAQEVNENPEVNFVNSLQGRVSGVNVTDGGSIGGSSRITLRGVSSLTGNNQPLFIVDGVYIDNSNLNPAGEFGGVDYGNAAMDINPQDIASISVLKGPNAAALYGSRASNGAIVIETKSGANAREGIGVNITSNTRFSEIAVLPDMQNEYGQGLYGQFEYVDGAGGGTFDGVDESWGPPLDGTPRVQWWSNGEPQPWVSNPDNVRSFFETGVTLDNTVSLAGNYDRTNFRLSATNLHQNGTIPNTRLQSNRFSLNAGADLSDAFRAEGRVTYTEMSGDNRPELGYSAENPMQQLTQWFGRQVDTGRLRDFTQEDGTPRNWNYNYHENPYWSQYMNTNEQERNRVTGGIDLRYELMDGLGLEGNLGTDFYRDSRENVLAVSTINDPQGDYTRDSYFVNQWRGNFAANLEQRVSEDMTLDGRLGFEHFQRQFENTFGNASSLIVPGVYTLENSAVRPDVSSFESTQATNSVYGSATVGYRDFIYLDLTGRNDWSSTLPADNNSYFYPSASISFIATDAFDLEADWLTYGKLRASWTRVGSDTDPFALIPYFQNQGNFGNVPRYTVDDVLANAELEPEFTESLELGGELRVLDDRLGLDLTWYNADRSNQIVPVQISAASGYQNKYVNVGTVNNTGVEATLDFSPLQSQDFQWDVTLNWAMNDNEVVSLAEGLDSFVHYGSWDVTVESRPGEEYGSLYGYGFLRDENGNIVVNSDGIPITDTSNQINFGSYEADWRGGISNNFSYRNFNLSFLVDFRQGGVLTSTTYMFGRYTGILEETLEGRATYTFDPDEEAYVRTGGGLIFDGGRWADGAVTQDGQPNDIEVGAQEFNAMFFGNAESHIFDASYVKLRELRVGYNLPVTLIDDLPFRSANVALIGRNLWIIHKNAPHIDPETAFNTGNVQGLESNQIPSVRSIGFSINLGF